MGAKPAHLGRLLQGSSVQAWGEVAPILAEIADGLVPALQRRGLVRREYGAAGFRENRTAPRGSTGMMVRAAICALLLCQPIRATGADDSSAQRQDLDFAAAEAEALARAPAMAVRRGQDLVLQLEDGRSATLTSAPECPPMRMDETNCVAYRLVRVFADKHAFLVHAEYYEGDDYRWIDRRTGRATKLPGSPIFGADPGHFLTISNAEAFDPSGIWLWKLTGDQPILVWWQEKPTEPLYCETKFIGWRHSDKIALDFVCLTRAQPPETTVPAMLIRKDSGWTLQVTWPRSGLPSGRN